MCDLGDRLECALKEQLDSGFGDPDAAAHGDVPLVSSRWDSVLSAVKPSTVILVNVSSTAEIQWTANESSSQNALAIGGRIAAGQPLTLDNFRGRIYCRTSAGAGTVNFSLLPRW